MELFGVIGWPLVLALVIALTAALKQSGVSGWYLFASALLIGCILGVGLEFYIAGAFSFQVFFRGVIYGLMSGLAACKVYDVQKELRRPE